MGLYCVGCCAGGITQKVSGAVPKSGVVLGRPILVLRASHKSGKPKAGYLESVLAAARAHGLPDGYVYELEHGEPAPRKAGAPLFKAPM